MADYRSLLSRQPSMFYIQAVEPTVVAVLDYARQEALLAQVPALERYFRLLLQRVAAANQTRWVYYYEQSLEERYRFFSSTFPEFVQRIPQYMLKQGLGIVQATGSSTSFGPQKAGGVFVQLAGRVGK